MAARCMPFSSYGIVFPDSRVLIFVNLRAGDHVDVVIDYSRVTKTRNTAGMTIPDIKSTLFDDGPPIITYLLEFAGSVDTARYLGMDGPDDEVLDDDEHEHNHESAMQVASFVLWYESLHAYNLQHSKIDGRTTKEKEEDIEICVICREEFQADEMIITLECKHNYHQECIKQWLLEKDVCPICRTAVFMI